MTIDDEKNALNDDFGYDIFSAGDFKVGDRVILRHQGHMKSHGGKPGKIVRVDTDGCCFPVTVRLDEFKPTPTEIAGGMGLPVCAAELRKAPENE